MGQKFMLRRGLATTLGLVGVVAMVGSQASSAAGAGNKADIARTRLQATALRDAFVKETIAAGFECAIQPPRIVVKDVPSFGMYDPETNTLTTPAWSQMPKEQSSIFYMIAGSGATEAAARKEFDIGPHHWVLVHELGHWWQACRKVADDSHHYAREFGANRIAAAYWREHDPSLVTHMQATFEGILSHSPNPVPAGSDAKSYFDTNYEQLGPTPAYIWFQSQMVIAAFAEMPVPTFVQALRETAP